MLEIEWRVRRLPPSPCRSPKGAIGPAQMESCGGLQVVWGSLSLSVSEDSWMQFVLSLTLWLLTEARLPSGAFPEIPDFPPPLKGSQNHLARLVPPLPSSWPP